MPKKHLTLTTLLFLLLTFVYIIPVSASEVFESSVFSNQSYDITGAEITDSASESIPDETISTSSENIDNTIPVDNAGDTFVVESENTDNVPSEEILKEMTDMSSSEIIEDSSEDFSKEEETEHTAEDLSGNTDSDTDGYSVPLPDLSTELIEEAADESAVGASVYTYINVTWSEFGAKGSDQKDDTTALNNALYAAATSAKQTGKTIEVYVPAGTYYISSVLHIYSNTWLHLHANATITRTNISREMLAGAHRDANNKICYQGCKHYGYTQVVNTKISGGRWNGGVSQSGCSGSVYSRDILTFRHCSNITIADTTIGDDCGIHTVNIDGVNNLTVSNVTFQNHYRYTGSEAGYYVGSTVNTSTDSSYWTRECLHIDEVNTDNYSGAYPLEVLPSLNITVTGCTFRNVVSGLGTHNYCKTNPCVNVMIKNNTFQTVYYNCINAFNFKDMTVINNNANAVTGFLYGKDCAGKNREYSYIQNNTVACGMHKGYPVQDTIHCVGTSKIFIENNTLRNVQGSGIVIEDGASSKTDTAYSEAVINVNLMENAAGKAYENKNYAAILVGKGCKINAWKNRIYLQEHTKSSYETYGVLLNFASKGCILTKNIIHGGNIGVYAKGTNYVKMNSNETKWTKTVGTFLQWSNQTELTGNMFTSNNACGLKAEGCNTIQSWRNCALWNGTRDLWLINSKPFNGIGTLSANTVLSTDATQTARKYVEGDVNFDGKLSVLDLQLLTKYVSNPDNATKAEFYMADIDHNGNLTNQDITVMTSRIVK